MNEHPNENWLQAKQHFDEIWNAYDLQQLNHAVSVSLIVDHVLTPLKRRYEEGERTQELYEAMMKVK